MQPVPCWQSHPPWAHEQAPPSVQEHGEPSATDSLAGLLPSEATARLALLWGSLPAVVQASSNAIEQTSTDERNTDLQNIEVSSLSSGA